MAAATFVFHGAQRCGLAAGRGVSASQLSPGRPGSGRIPGHPMLDLKKAATSVSPRAWSAFTREPTAGADPTKLTTDGVSVSPVPSAMMVDVSKGHRPLRRGRR